MLEIALGGAGGVAAVALVGLGEIDAGGVFCLVFVDDDVALVVIALADQPAEDAAGIAGSAMRLSAVLPYQVVTLSLEIERQNVSCGSETLIQRSIRANRPSTRGR